MAIFKYFGATVTRLSYSQELQAQCLLPLSSESFIFLYSSRNCKDKNKVYSGLLQQGDAVV